MGVNRITLDTNILIYAFNADSTSRHLQAITVIEQALKQDCVLTLQTLAEFLML